MVLAHSQPLAFPGAEGFGKYATGGRGGKVLVVSNLNDAGPGSLREAVSQKYPRMVVFAVAGTIKLKSELDIKYGNISILGQSAPGQGITVRDYPVRATQIENVIIRFIRSRLGDQTKQQGDAMTIKNCKNVIVDHCSFSWATDECASIYDNEDITVQYCMITESLNNSVHQKGEHGYGGIWGGKKASFHHNLFANHKSRTPRFHGARYHKSPKEEIVDFRNNFIYNWAANNSYGGEEGTHNVVNNVYKAGPATRSKKDKILDPFEPYGTFYLEGNILIGDDEVTENNWKGVNHIDQIPQIKRKQPVEVISIQTEPTQRVMERVLNEAGASYRRDAVDERIVNEIRNGQPTYSQGIIDSQDQVGGWPVLKKGEKVMDSDLDGMPDPWEKRKGLNPKRSEDAMEKSLNKDYSNVELYLHELLNE